MKTRKQYAKEIRYKTKQDTKCQCKLCKMCLTNKDVQIHHLIKVEDLSKIAYYKQLDTNDLYIPTENLCDYHHKLWHAMIGDRCLINRDEIDIDDLEMLFEVFDEINFDKVPEDLYMDYYKVYDEMMEHFIFELEHLENERSLDEEDSRTL